MLHLSLRIYALSATALGLAVAVVSGFQDPGMPASAWVFMVGWLAISVLALMSAAELGRLAAELIALFALLVGWRIAALSGADLLSLVLIPAFLCYALGFFFTARHALSGGVDPGDPLSDMGPTDWHLTFLRLYVGLDFVPHFTEKFFAGPEPHAADVAAFQALGLGEWSAPLVWLGGLCEFGAAVGIGLGLFTRVAAVGTALYLLIATIIGGHFQLGFIWATPGGGWEYPALWMVIVASFAYRGAGGFSLDGAICASRTVPRWIEWLMGGNGRAGH